MAPPTTGAGGVAVASSASSSLIDRVIQPYELVISGSNIRRGDIWRYRPKPGPDGTLLIVQNGMLHIDDNDDGHTCRGIIISLM